MFQKFQLTLSILLAGILIFAISCSSQWDIQNPYSQVDWQNHQQYKASLHVHTTRSDGGLNPHQVVDRYHELGYQILALTDHNGVTYPWTSFSQLSPSRRNLERMGADALVYEDRDPKSLGMIAIQANELSSHHHMGSFFNDHVRPAYDERITYSITEEESIRDVAAKNGLVMLYHPGRYDRTVDWYVDLYTRYDHIFGLEVFNQGDRYPSDRMVWDSILAITMPQRPVWGYSNDDMHGNHQLGFNWNMMILPELSLESTRRGLENGISYFVYAPQGHEGPQVPRIDDISVNNRRGTIHIKASNTQRIIWISEGETIHQGNILNLNEHPDIKTYVRAELHGEGKTVAGTQPFGIGR